MWRETPVPPILSQFQDLTNSLPTAYKEHGLRKLIVQQEKYKYEYDDLLEALAELIIQAYDVNLKPLEPPPDLDKVKEAFPDAASVTAPTTAVYQPVAGGPNSVRFAYVTSTSSR
jgi:hypothetical protein